MKFGAHVSTAKPFSEAIHRAKDIGCDCIQIFANPPQRWNPTMIDPLEIERFKKLKKEYKIDPVVIHSIYLINLASENTYFYQTSINSILDDMVKAKKIGAIGANAHLGSTKGKNFDEVLPKVLKGIEEILIRTDDEIDFIIENSAGAGSIIGDTLEEIGKIIKSMKSNRIKVIIDTAHLFASGYDIRNTQGVDKFIEKFEKEIGLSKLVGFHFNDSKTGLNSKKDRHADIGKGEIGLEAFRVLINHTFSRNLFAILETPEDELSWEEQLNLLRDLEN